MKTVVDLWRSFLRLLARKLGWKLIRLILWTCHIEIRGMAHFLMAAQQGPCLLAFWHNRLLVVPYILSEYAPNFQFTAFASHSRDGQLLESITDHYSSAKVLSVPHDARHLALKALIESLQKGEVIVITPDGPQGPRYQVKPGSVVGARIAEAKIVPLHWSANRFWQFKTWDRMILPKPFARIYFECSPAISFTADGSNSLERDVHILESALFYGTKHVNEEALPNPDHWPK